MSDYLSMLEYVLLSMNAYIRVVFRPATLRCNQQSLDKLVSQSQFFRFDKKNLQSLRRVF